MTVPGTWLAEKTQRASVNGRKVWECWGWPPEDNNATNDFWIVSIEMASGGPKVEWKQKTNRWMGAVMQAVLKGAAGLEGPREAARVCAAPKRDFVFLPAKGSVVVE